MNRTNRTASRSVVAFSIAALLALAVRQSGADEAQQAAAEQEPISVVPTEQVKWTDGPKALPSGCQIAVIHGDPSRDGEQYTLRLRFPANYQVPAHWHPRDEYVTVLSGTVHFGRGDQLDKDNAQKLPAGSFFFVAAKHPHFVWNEEPTVLQLHGVGPFDITYVEAANDPRKSGR